MGRNQELKWLAFSLYPLSFFLYSPFKWNTCIITSDPPFIEWHFRCTFETLISPLFWSKVWNLDFSIVLKQGLKLYPLWWIQNTPFIIRSRQKIRVYNFTYIFHILTTVQIYFWKEKYLQKNNDERDCSPFKFSELTLSKFLGFLSKLFFHNFIKVLVCLLFKPLLGLDCGTMGIFCPKHMHMHMHSHFSQI